MLHDNGLIDLSQEILPHFASKRGKGHVLKDATHAQLRAEVTNNTTTSKILIFDSHDSKIINKTNLLNCDLYFKRSFDRKYISEYHFEEKDKIFPLGLNYLVLPNEIDFYGLHRHLILGTSFRKKIAGVVNSLDIRNLRKYHPRLRTLCSLPKYSLSPRVLFMAAAYDPYDNPDRPKDKIEERIHNNEFRADCIRMLRKKLGRKFYGGFSHDDYSTKNYKDVLIDIPANAEKKNYLSILDNFQICVATTGLHGSIGWKLAEYVAFSKAIVSEKLQYEIPGPFYEDQNYLEFSSPEACVEQATKLLDDCEQRNQLCFNNALYYQHYVKPDMLLFNALSISKSNLKNESIHLLNNIY